MKQPFSYQPVSISVVGIPMAGTPVTSIAVQADLALPANARGLVIFSHGSGSSRFSSRNRYVAEVLQANRIATLLVDLLTEPEDAVYANRFDINLLTNRLLAVTEWMEQQTAFRQLPIGYFGASTGAASALWAAARLGMGIKAVVSRGGRPDLAIEQLGEVQAPVLLVVGSLDERVLELNEQAFEQLTTTKDLVIIPGASHLFEEPGKLEEVAQRATDWFSTYLTGQYL